MSGETMGRMTSNESAPSLDSNSTLSTNPWNQERLGANSLDHTGWFSCEDGEEKLSFIKANAVRGFCYLWLMLFVERLQVLSLEEFKSFASSYMKSCGEFPVAEEAITELMSACMLEIFPRNSNLSGKSLSVELINHMMASKVRLSYQDSGVLHIEPITMGTINCDCRDIFCEHGWAARYIMTILTVSNKKLGATINFDSVEFEDDDYSDDAASFLTVRNDFRGEQLKHEALNTKPLNTRDQTHKLSGLSGDRGGRNVPRDMGMREPSGNQKASRELRNNDAMSRLAGAARKAANANSEFSSGSRREKRSVSDRLEQAVKDVISEISSLDTDDLEQDEGINPDDSSSNFGVRRRRNGSYMSQGSVLNPPTGFSSVSRSTQPAQLVRGGNLTTGPMVQGFLKSDRMSQLEAEAVQSVNPINGLASPLKSDRLMLLMHIHTALSTRRIYTDDPDSLFNGLRKLTESAGRTASERLLLTVVNATFEVERMDVVSNAFNLPYIEVGMRISGAMLMKCFHQLGMEYEILWFDQFKALRIPSFHTRFLEVSETDPNTRSRARSKGRSSGQPDRSRQKKKRTGSLLNF